jgi:hypothetical protein
VRASIKVSKSTDTLIHWTVGHLTINKCSRRWQWNAGGGLAVETGAMMTMTVSTNVQFGRVGKGDGGCNGDGEGNSDSGGNTFTNQQMVQSAMECRGGLTVEEGGMMMMMESTNAPFGGVGKGDGNCVSDGDDDSYSGSNAFNNQQMCKR